MIEPIVPDAATASTTPTAEPVLRPEARIVRADRSLAAMVLVICTLGGMGVGFGFAMYLMRAQLAYAPLCGGRFAAVQVSGDSETWLGVKYNPLSRPGNTITQVISDTGAARAGLVPGDMVMTIEGRSLRGGDLHSEVIAHVPGEVVNIGLLRNGRPMMLRASLGAH